MKHGAEVKSKRCNSIKGCANQAIKGGVCVKHGTKEKNTNNAAAKDALIIPSKEDYAGDTVHTATITKNLLCIVFWIRI